ncbi:MAG TPA: DUF2807 domain-containing protein, partial [Telluria sp.]|nr:DUF2807 domain-containing protein [Telluria sp.]
MTSLLKYSALAALLAAGVAATYPSHADPARSELVTEQRQVGAFKAIELAGPYHVVIHAEGKDAVELSGERKQLA